MFEFNTWIVNNLISGVKGGKFSKEWAAVQLGNYFVKGKVTEEDIARFEEETFIPEPEVDDETEHTFLCDENAEV